MTRLFDIASVLRAWVADRRGNFATILCVVSPVVLGVVGGAVDMLIFVNHRSELQSTADAAVLAVAQEASLKGWNAAAANKIADSIVHSTLTSKFGVEHTFDLTIEPDQRRAEIRVHQDHYGYFLIGYLTSSPQITVSATAFSSAQAPTCIIVQSPAEKEALMLDGKSRVEAAGCAAYSNSKSPSGVNVKADSLLRTQLACSAGGYTGKASSYSPVPLTDCPPIPDPLAGRAKIVDAEFRSGCDYKKIEVKGGLRTLHPGNYCNGLTITDGAQVTLQPGTYVFVNSRLRVDKGAKLSGTGVGLVFTGDDAELKMEHDSTISLAAPSEGSMAGILVYAQPAKKSRKFSIVSKNAQKMIGTVYLPGDALTVGGDGDIDGACDPIVEEDGTITLPGPNCLADMGSASDWTAIIARRLKVTAGSTLVMNTNYGGSSIPVPAGVGPSNGTVRLAQ